MLLSGKKIDFEMVVSNNKDTIPELKKLRKSIKNKPKAKSKGNFHAGKRSWTQKKIS